MTFFQVTDGVTTRTKIADIHARAVRNEERRMRENPTQTRSRHGDFYAGVSGDHPTPGVDDVALDGERGSMDRATSPTWHAVARGTSNPQIMTRSTEIGSNGSGWDG